jgi:hypothetical protein
MELRVDAMIGARKSLYLDALYSLEIDGWGDLAVDVRGHAPYYERRLILISFISK